MYIIPFIRSDVIRVLVSKTKTPHMKFLSQYSICRWFIPPFRGQSLDQ